LPPIMMAISNKVRKAVREIRVVIVTVIMQSVLNYALHNKAYFFSREVIRRCRFY